MVEGSTHGPDLRSLSDITCACGIVDHAIMDP